MALVDVDSWVTEYEACERLSHTILRQIAQRDQLETLSPDYDRLSASIQTGLKQLETDLKQLKEKLNAAATNAGGRTLTMMEIERRQQQYDRLQSQLQQQKNRFINATRSNRLAMLEQSQLSSTWQRANNEAAIIDTDNLQAQKQQQVQIIENQNRGLDMLSQTISRQRQLASQLGQEVEDQNEILDNLADTMERIDTRVNTVTQNMVRVDRPAGVWLYWIVILTLFVAIVIVTLCF